MQLGDIHLAALIRWQMSQELRTHLFHLITRSSAILYLKWDWGEPAPLDTNEVLLLSIWRNEFLWGWALSHLPRTKWKRRNFNCDYRDLGCTSGTALGSKCPLTSWRVSQSRGHAGISSRKRVAPEYHIQLRDKISVSCQEPLVGSQSQEYQWQRNQRRKDGRKEVRGA